MTTAASTGDFSGEGSQREAREIQSLLAPATSVPVSAWAPADVLWAWKMLRETGRRVWELSVLPLQPSFKPEIMSEQEDCFKRQDMTPKN